MNEGFASIFMINGTYYDLLIRICAYLTFITTDLLYAPAVFNSWSFFVYLVCSIYIFKPWLYPRRSVKWLAIDLIVIVVLGFTGANSALYLPIVLFVFVLKRQWRCPYQIVLCSTFLIVGLIQLYHITSADLDQRTAGQGAVVMAQVYRHGAHFLFDTFVSIVSGPTYFYIFDPTLHMLLLVFVLLFIGFAFYRMLKGDDVYFKVFIFLITSIIISLATVMAWRKLPFAIVPPANPATRYIATQTCLILFSLILLIQPRSRKWIYGLIALFVWSTFPMHNLLKEKGWLNDQDGEWANVVDRYKRGEICTLPILYIGTHFIHVEDCQLGVPKTN